VSELDGRRFPRLLIAVAAAAAAAGIGAGVGLHIALGSAATPQRIAVPALHGQAVWDAGRRAAPTFALRDQKGDRVSLAAERGRTVLLAFMDPLCKQECPLEGRALAAAERQVAPAQRPVLLIVSVNPKATAADAKSASRRWDIAGSWHWLLGGRAQLTQVWRAYDITVIPEAGDIVHSTAVYVIDRRGFERVGLIAPFLPPFLADDLRALAHESA
jgi:cytochrome oxidase Cu insertion factor (SCO1/SenC/PrrC family)